MIENNETIIENNAKDKPSALQTFFIRATAAEVACVAILILGIIAIKNFFPAFFPEIREFYNDNFTVETEADEVLSDGDKNEI